MGLDGLRRELSVETFAQDTSSSDTAALALALSCSPDKCVSLLILLHSARTEASHELSILHLVAGRKNKMY